MKRENILEHFPFKEGDEVISITRGKGTVVELPPTSDMTPVQVEFEREKGAIYFYRTDGKTKFDKRELFHSWEEPEIISIIPLGIDGAGKPIFVGDRLTCCLKDDLVTNQYVIVYDTNMLTNEAKYSPLFKNIKDLNSWKEEHKAKTPFGNDAAGKPFFDGDELLWCYKTDLDSIKLLSIDSSFMSKVNIMAIQGDDKSSPAFRDNEDLKKWKERYKNELEEKQKHRDVSIPFLTFIDQHEGKGIIINTEDFACTITYGHFFKLHSLNYMPAKIKTSDVRLQKVSIEDLKVNDIWFSRTILVDEKANSSNGQSIIVYKEELCSIRFVTKRNDEYITSQYVDLRDGEVTKHKKDRNMVTEVWKLVELL